MARAVNCQDDVAPVTSCSRLHFDALAFEAFAADVASAVTPFGVAVECLARRDLECEVFRVTLAAVDSEVEVVLQVAVFQVLTVEHCEPLRDEVAVVALHRALYEVHEGCGVEPALRLVVEVAAFVCVDVFEPLVFVDCDDRHRLRYVVDQSPHIKRWGQRLAGVSEAAVKVLEVVVKCAVPKLEENILRAVHDLAAVVGIPHFRVVRELVVAVVVGCEAGVHIVEHCVHGVECRILPVHVADVYGSVLGDQARHRDFLSGGVEDPLVVASRYREEVLAEVIHQEGHFVGDEVMREMVSIKVPREFPLEDCQLEVVVVRVGYAVVRTAAAGFACCEVVCSLNHPAVCDLHTVEVREQSFVFEVSLVRVRAFQRVHPCRVGFAVFVCSGFLKSVGLPVADVLGVVEVFPHLADGVVSAVAFGYKTERFRVALVVVQAISADEGRRVTLGFAVEHQDRVSLD